MAQTKFRPIKEGFLIAFVGLCVVLIIITFAVAFQDSAAAGQGAAARQYIVSSQATATPQPTPTPTVPPNAVPTPTLAYWEIQE